jgi:hypothetical protein
VHPSKSASKKIVNEGMHPLLRPLLRPLLHPRLRQLLRPLLHGPLPTSTMLWCPLHLLRRMHAPTIN